MVNKWEESNNTKIARRRIWKTIPLSELISTVHPHLHTIPLTFLDSSTTGKPLTDSQVRMIYEIKQPRLRNTAFSLWQLVTVTE